MLADNPNLNRVAAAYLALRVGAGFDPVVGGNASDDSDAMKNFERMNVQLKVAGSFSVLEVLFASMAAGLCWAEVILKKNNIPKCAGLVLSLLAALFGIIALSVLLAGNPCNPWTTYMSERYPAEVSTVKDVCASSGGTKLPTGFGVVPEGAPYYGTILLESNYWKGDVCKPLPAGTALIFTIGTAPFMNVLSWVLLIFAGFSHFW
jgi:hypothetical protein